MRYASARFEEADRNEIYRIYVTECLRAVIGARIGYHELVSDEQADFDAQQVVDDVVTKAGLEVEREPSRADG